MTRIWLCAAVFGLQMTFAGTMAQAAPIAISGSSTSTFTNLTNCSGGDCAITTTGNPLFDPQVQWGSTNQFINLVNPSTLTAPSPLAFSGLTSTTLTIGELTWYNSATRSDQTDDNFNVNWNLAVVFSAPTGSTGDTQTFALNITNPSNPPGDHINNLTLSDLAGLNFSLPGVTVSNLQYHVTDGSGSGTSSLTCSAGSCSWNNDELNHSTLTITADFSTATAANPIPEPGTMALLGAGLLGLGAIRGRRRG